MIFLLFLFCLFITVSAYYTSPLKLLSPTLIGSGVMTTFSLIYIVTYPDMNSDISFLTFCVISLSLLTTAVGEWLGCKLRLPNMRISGITNLKGEQSGPIQMGRIRIYLITAFLLYVAVSRFQNLRLLTGGSFITETLIGARQITVENSDVVLGSTLMNQFVYVSNLLAYICIYAFLYNVINYRKRCWHMFLPLIPDFAFRIMTTGRTSFMLLILAVPGCYVLIRLQKNEKRIKIPLRYLIAFVLAVFVIYIYGVIRNQAHSIPIVNYLQMYTCAGIYGLDLTIDQGIQSPFMGYYTLQEILPWFDNRFIKVPIVWDTFIFTKSGVHSNIYTSLFELIEDFGILWMLVFKLLEGLIAAVILKKIAYGRLSNSSRMILLVYGLLSIFTYFMYAFGDVARFYLGNPLLMLRYLIILELLVRIYLRSGKKVRTGISDALGLDDENAILS